MQTSQSGPMWSKLANRRQLSRVLSGVLIAAVTVSGCGSTPTGPTSEPPSPTGNVVGTVASNHDRPHVAVITAAQLAVAAPIVIDISNGLHSHTVTITAAQMGQIAAGTRVSVTSSMDPHSNGTDPHSHVVTFN